MPVSKLNALDSHAHSPGPNWIRLRRVLTRKKQLTRLGGSVVADGRESTDVGTDLDIEKGSSLLATSLDKTCL